MSLSLQVKSEDYSPESLDKLHIDIGPLYSIYNQIINYVRDIVNGNKNFLAVYIEGLYGTGKTLLLRKSAHDIVNKPEFEKVIPIYFYLGEAPFLPYTNFSRFIEYVENYVVGRDVGKQIVFGKRENWKHRLSALKKCQETVHEMNIESELDELFETMKCLNREQYHPILIFDEFERIIYTGESLREAKHIVEFSRFVNRYLELTRGHIYTGGFILATTKHIGELLEKACIEEKLHIRSLVSELRIRCDEKIAEQFPMLAGHIVYDVEEKISWNRIFLESLAKRYNIIVHSDILSLVSEVLPTPRAIIQIAHKIRSIYGEKLGREISEEAIVVSHRDFFDKLIRPRIDEFINKIKSEKVNGVWIIPSQALWHERFYKLLENNLYVIKRNNFIDVAKVLNIDISDEKKARQRVSNILQKLSEVGLYEHRGPGEYYLNPYILAYALGIERLPTGEHASLDNLIMNVKTRVKQLRDEMRKKREEGEKDTQLNTS